jgi:hypothetical protein
MRIRDILNPEFFLPLYDTKHSLHIMGAPGTGKSSVVRKDMIDMLSAAHKREFGCIVLDAPGIDAVDVQGFPVPTKLANGQLVATVARSAHMPTDEYLEAYPNGVLVIEERNAGDQLLQKTLNQVVLERRFGKFHLPKGWWVISLSNRTSDRSGASKPMAHSINRECVVELELNINDHITHWEAVGASPYAISCAKRNAAMFATEVPAEPRPFCTPRSYTYAWNYLVAAAKGDVEHIPTSLVAQQAVGGFIGEGAAATMFAYLAMKDEVPSIDEIKRDPRGCKVPERLDATYMVAQNCVHFADSSNIGNIWTYVERLQKEIQTSCATSLLKKVGGTLQNSPALAKWIANNSALIAETMRD